MTAGQPCRGREYCGRFPFCGCGRPDPLPERDRSKPSDRQGLFRKFEVTRNDGSSAPGGKHEGCEYFVLDVKHDPFAKPALSAYAEAVEATNAELAADIRARFEVSESALASLERSLALDNAKRLIVYSGTSHWLTEVGQTRCWYDTTRGATDDYARAVQYLELRAEIERHPEQPHLVRLINHPFAKKGQKP